MRREIQQLEQSREDQEVEEEEEEEEEMGEVSKLINTKENTVVRINMSSEGMTI